MYNTFVPWGSPAPPRLVVPYVGPQASMPPPSYPAAQAQPMAPPPAPAPSSQGSVAGGGNQGQGSQGNGGRGGGPVEEDAAEMVVVEEVNGITKVTRAREIKVGSLNPTENEDVVPESQDDEFEEGEIKEAFRIEEYDGIYLELGLLQSCEMRNRDASDRAQRMMQRYLVRDGHLFVKRQVRNPRRVVCGRNRQIDIIVALHDDIVRGHRGVHDTYAKISELYYSDEMMEMVDHMGWAMTQLIERLRGAGRFAEPIAQIRREARTRPEVKPRMQELRPSPVGPDGRPIRLEIRNAEEFIPAFEQFMHGQDQPSGPPPPKPYGIKEMWDEFLDQHGEGLTAPEKAEVGTSKKADEYLDRKIRFLSKTSFDRYMMLEADLRGKKMKEMSHGIRLEAVEAEVRELWALVASQAAIIQDLRQQPRGGVDRAESSQQGEQRQAGHGLSGQPSAAEPQQGSSMGRAILEPEEAKAKREAEREAFEFRAPIELATLPIEAAEPTMPLSVEEGLPSASSEPVQGSAEGSMDVLLEVVHTMMQEEANLFSPEQRIEEPPESEMGVAIESIIEGRPQRLDTPEYRPKEVGIRPGPCTQELGTGPEEPTDVPQSYGLGREACEAPSSPGSQREKKKFKKWFDASYFFCKKEGHRALQCPKFLKDLAEGKVTRSGGKMYDRQGRVVERSADGGRAQLYRQNQEEMSE
ncbi:hypothetical protein CBR_g60003 [Chara braunii]|uniref:CCHC-type domain-containing protein n=1 Tax=Chara braunii TaxID=69332 RepID=A0A388K8G0_CHABU|nr:hypothetical protein CBR_g60003 [Chara braunii]|eukprot:GBG66352.1 hypothetical protein CBR_g60003 [Chara braunii]